MCSRKNQAPAGTIRKGAHDPIRAAFAMLLFVAPEKNTAKFNPKRTPGIHTLRMSRSATHRPVLHKATFHTRLTVARRQNATSTPAVSARLTNVELSENATTSPRTASTPRVFALRPRIHAGARAACGTALPRHTLERRLSLVDRCDRGRRALTVRVRQGKDDRYYA